MKILLTLGLMLSSLSSFAESCLIKKCINKKEGVEVLVFNRLSESGDVVEAHTVDRYLYKVEVLFDNALVYKTSVALLSKENNEYYSATTFSLNFAQEDNVRLYLSYRDRFGAFLAPSYNTLKLNCLNLNL